MQQQGKQGEGGGAGERESRHPKGKEPRKKIGCVPALLSQEKVLPQHLGKNMSKSDHELSLLSCSISFHSRNNYGVATALEKAQGG